MENRPLSAGWLLHIQTLFRNALALCNAAHLKSLKDFDKKVADLCLKQPDKSTNLRTVTTPELLAADRKIWNTISDLLRDGLKRNDDGSKRYLQPTSMETSTAQTPANPRAASQGQREG